MPENKPSRKESKNTQTNSPASGKKALNVLFLQQSLLFVFAFLLYANTIPNQFNLDDELYHNRATDLSQMGFKGVVKAFTMPTFIEGDYAYERRSVSLASFVVQYQLLGSSVHVSHFINVFLYALTCFLLFRLLLKWLGQNSNWLAFFTVLLFVAHPLHTEVVASIKNRDELLAGLLAICSFLLAWRFYTSVSKKYLYLSLSLLLFLLAILSKKTIAPFFLVVPLSFYFFGDLPLKKALGYAFVFALPMIFFRISGAFLLNIHFYRPVFVHENPLYAPSTGILHRIPTALYVMGRYLWLHVFPYKLAYYYGVKYVPVVTWWNSYVWFSLCLHLALAVFIIKQFRGKSFLGFGLIVYLVGVLTFSNLFIPSPGIIAERFAYMSSFGFCIVIASLTQWLLTAQKHFTAPALTGSRQWQILLLAIATLYTIRSFARTGDWYDKKTLFTHDMPILESSAKANSMYAEMLVGEARNYRSRAREIGFDQFGNARILRDSASLLLSQAKYHYGQALAISPGFPNALNNIGLIYIDEDSMALAKSYLRMSLSTTTNKARTYDDLGMIHFKGRDYDSARQYFNKAISADSMYVNGYCNLSKLLIEVKDTINAEKVLQAIAHKDTSNSIPNIQLADIAAFKRDTQSMVFYCRLASEQKPANTAILNFLVQHYRARNNTDSTQYYLSRLNLVQR